MNVKRIHTIYYLATFFLIANLVSVFIISYFLFMPVTILTIDNPIQVISSTYKEVEGVNYPVVFIGDELIIRFKYHKKYSYPEHTYRSIYCDDGNLATVTDIYKNMPLGKFTITYGGDNDPTHSLVIPQKISKNILCYVRYLITYKVNFLRTITYPTQTEKFYVIDRGGE